MSRFRFSIPTSIRCTCIALLAIAAQAGAQGFERRTFEIPMRDGVHLHTVALVPTAASDALPIMLIRTPYSADRAFPNTELPSSYTELAKDGYFFVVQDIRGRYRSEGQFVMNRAQHDPKDPRGVDESTDAYDTVDWLLKNLRGNNGKVGVMGVSYPGWLAGIAGVDAHPAVKAISPQAPMTDTWLGDDFFHQGAFRQTFGFEYAYSMEATNDGTKNVQIDRYDRYDWYLQFQTLKQLAAAGGANSLPSWQAFSTHPSYDAFWQAKAMQNHLRTPTMAILTVGGFWDQEDLFGPIKAYSTLEPNDAKGLNFFVEGPWFHGQWSRPGGDAIGNVKFGSNTADYYRENIQRPWFAYWLHGTGDGKFPEAWIFESGENAWHTFSAWPPPNAAPRTLYFQADGKLSWAAPSAASGFDAYVSDPAHPVPYTPRPVDGSRWRQWLTEDQRFVDNRPDVLSWQTGALTEDVTIAGNIVANLFASTTGSDADWVVKLIDVYPDSVAGDPRMGGYQLMVATDILRGRYRNSFSKPERIPPHTVVPFHVDLHQQLYRFKRGHRIMVQVQSTWFPLYDRNPQTYVPNIFNASPADFRAQTHRIWRSAKYPSGVAVSVLPSN
ncbi:MAG: CocE/NonD family hydrolase [Gemmatimonadaceae bacterium]